MATSGSVVITKVEDKAETTPKQPKTYRMVLKMSWKRFKEFFQSKEASDSQKKMQKERKAILSKINKGEHISDEERDFLNKSFKQMILSLFQNLENFLFSYLELEENDSQQLQSFKLTAATEITAWLKYLDVHISKCLEEILDPNMPENEMLVKTQKILDDLKNEIKPENFSDISSASETLNENFQTQQYDDEEGIWDTIFADYFIL